MSALYDLVDGTWHTTRTAFGTARELFVLDRDTSVWRIDPHTGEYLECLGDGFDGDHLVVEDGVAHVFCGPATVHRGHIYTVEDRTLWAIDPATGDHDVVADRMHTRLLAGCGSALFSFERHGDLVRIGVG